ncbi:hypothetical protein NQU96_05640 [Pseudoalteromonas elyakovii]|uniref:Uncharacterized protein n=1 Tax=Pseudoalteromonas gelatinilytica TaxID=1703256 RepID=A0ABQ1UBA3_9GAMM|nr:hypothetical protein [Pseudoalteromonas profundi]MDC3189216.1 hypothetical protein [Pseudoalteromonas elyakovii]GGF13983.1 hypothetical protein GCM10008027_43480 [Pseudoalteromonas profundi]
MSYTNSNLIAHVKKRAKKLHKQNRDKQNSEKTLSQCLEECSQDLGYRDYHDLMQQANSLNNSVASRTCLIDKYPDLVNKAFNNCITKEPKEELIAKFWDLLRTPINNESSLEDIEKLTRWEINKETLKDYGYSCLESKKTQYEDLGYLLLAMGHYFRSVMDNCRYQIAEHPKFTDYFGLWLRSMYPNSNSEQNSSTVICELKQFYTFNENEELFKGATSWAPKWWLKEQGRI